jgi:hypothetical protein
MGWWGLIIEILTSLAAGALVGGTYFSSGSDAQKIQKICANCGLIVKENKSTKTIQLLRRTPFDWGTEYAYRIPLGLSFSDFEKKLDHLQDGINNKKTVLDIRWHNIKNINLRGNIKEQIKSLFDKTQIRKEIELQYDGVLKIMVYNQPLTEQFEYTHELLEGCKGWNIPVGTTRNKMFYHDFDKLPHMIVAGMTTYGKTVFMKMLITTFIAKQPENVKFTLIDLKGGLAFNRFKNCSQVNTVAKNYTETLKALESIHKDMEKRMKIFLDKGYENVGEAKLKERHFIIIDEAAELTPKGDQEAVKKIKAKCQHLAAEIARIGAGIGYRLIFCTQYPTAEALPQQIKQNAVSKVCFPLDTEVGSRVVLDESGADKLPLIKGRAIYKTDRKVIVQTPLIKNDFIQQVIEPHIVLKPRKDEPHEPGQRKENRTDTIEFEKA